jgi:hypothetical protein
VNTRICNFYNQETCTSRGDHQTGQTLWKHLCKKCFADRPHRASLPFIKENYRVIIDSLYEDITDYSDHKFFIDFDNSRSTYVSNTNISCKLGINDELLFYNDCFNKFNFSFNSTVDCSHIFGGSYSLSTGSEYNPSASVRNISHRFLVEMLLIGMCVCVRRHLICCF